MDIFTHNQSAWERESREGGNWSTIVAEETIENAKLGRHNYSMSPDKRPIPHGWLESCQGAELLCLGGGGGQQGPILSAMGARVTVFDCSPNQLRLDQLAAEKYGFNIKTIQGDMRDLASLDNESFDLVVNPASNMFIDDVKRMWRECHRVLRPRGKLLSTSMNPIAFAFGRDELDVDDSPRLKYSVPYSDLECLPADVLNAKIESRQPLEFGHSLEDIIGGQIEAGFALIGFQEGYWGPRFEVKADRKFPQYLATCAMKRPLS